MKYIFATGCTLRQREGGYLYPMYEYLCERYQDVSLYHRCCRKAPLFGAETTVISVCPDCLKAYEGIPGVRTLSFWELIREPENPAFRCAEEAVEHLRRHRHCAELRPIPA